MRLRTGVAPALFAVGLLAAAPPAHAEEEAGAPAGGELRATHRVAGTVRDHRHEDPTVPDGEAFHAYPITYERTSRLNRRAVAVTHRQQVDEGAAAARVDEDDYRRIGDPVAVEVAKGGQVVYQPGVHPLRRAGAERD